MEHPIKWGVCYPISGVHVCPFGLKQAEGINFLAQCEGINSRIVVDYAGNGVWKDYEHDRLETA